MTDRTPEEAFAGIDDIEAPKPLATIDARDLIARNIPATPFIVDHIFPEASLVLWTGESGSGKTALAMHAAVAVALGEPVGGQFATRAAGGPVLYLNGELEPVLLQNVLRAAAAGLGVTIADVPAGALRFEGADGMATVRFRVDRTDGEQRQRFEATLQRHQPKLVILDTQRAIFDLDEKEAMQVRDEFTWLRQLAARFRCCILVLHHLRKQNAVSNSARDRVSGSGDLVAGVDVHVQAKSTGGRPLHALYFDKTRYPRGPYRSGVECAVEAIFEAPADDTSDPGRSAFVISAPEGEIADVAAETATQRDIIARLEAEGPLTRNQLGAGETGSGNMRKAFSELAARRRIVKTGQKTGRSDLWDVRPADNLFHEPGPGDEARLGPDDDECAETPVTTAFEPGLTNGARLSPEADLRQTARRPGPPSNGGDPSRSRQTERTGPPGPNPYKGPGSQGPGSRSTHAMVCLGCKGYDIVRLSDQRCAKCVAQGAGA